MNRRVFAFTALLLFLAFSCVASAYVHSTVTYYQTAPACGKLAGLGGLLQATHFIQLGNCAVNSNGSCSRFLGTCTIPPPPSGHAQSGHCFTYIAGTPDNPNFGCVCLVDLF